MELIAVLTTFESEPDAARVLRALVERRLIACGNILPGARSIFRWQGEVEDASEVVCILKTRRERLTELVEVLGELHPYDVPEIVALPVLGGGEPYLDWVRSETRMAAGDP
ncbi:MAG: divalent-cation tolerance protein CutA [Candidatus Eiseniibacteriota bacterium]